MYSRNCTRCTALPLYHVYTIVIAIIFALVQAVPHPTPGTPSQVLQWLWVWSCTCCLSASFSSFGIHGIYPDVLTFTNNTITGGHRAYFMDLPIHRLLLAGPKFNDLYDRSSEEEIRRRVTFICMPRVLSALWSGCRHTVAPVCTRALLPATSGGACADLYI